MSTVVDALRHADAIGSIHPALVHEAANTIEAMQAALRNCVEHMEWSTPEGKAAYAGAVALAGRAALASGEG
jgi:hypothetical protein